MGRHWHIPVAVVVIVMSPARSLHAVEPARQFLFSKQVSLVPGAYKFVFKLYDSPTAKTSLWSSGTVALTLKTPVLVYNLGSGAAKIPDTIDYSQQLYLEVAKISPPPTVIIAKRERLPIVPYALHSESLSVGSVNTTMIMDGTIADADIDLDANIADSKLAQITSAGKVAASALPATVVRTDLPQTIIGQKTFQTGMGTPFAVDAADNDMVDNLFAARAASADSLGGLTLTDLDARFGSVAPSPAGKYHGYSLATPDSGGDVGHCSSITIGADGLPIISYIDGLNRKLKVYHCANAACSTGSAVTAATIGDVGRYTSMTIGADGLPIISYCANETLWVENCGDAACSPGLSRPTSIDAAGNVGRHNSITIGTDGMPVISYYDLTNGDLKVYHCANTACIAGTATTVDSAGDVGLFSSITIGANGLPIISYYDDTNRDLKIYHCANAACTLGAASTVESTGDVGAYSSITIGADGLPIISYRDTTDLDLHLKAYHCANTACTAGTATTVDSAWDVGLFSSITIGANGLPIISYYDWNNRDLRVYHCANIACTAGTATTVDSAGDVGGDTSITIGADGLPIISYLDSTNGDLKVAKGFSKPLGRR